METGQPKGVTAVLEGHISVRAVIEAKSRDIEAVYVQEDTTNPEVLAVSALAQVRGIRVERVGAGDIAAKASGATHGGIVAVTGPRRFGSLHDLPGTGPRPFVAMLDGVEDPLDFGAAVRALYAAGVDGLVLRPRNWMSAGGTVARVSAGASELIAVAVAPTAADAARYFQGLGMRVACTGTGAGARSIYEADLAGPLFLVIGGEKRGITRSFMNQADVVLRIPYGRRFAQSLTIADAASVIAFEALRQRIAARSRDRDRSGDKDRGRDPADRRPGPPGRDDCP